MNTKEYVLWGIRPNEESESLLITEIEGGEKITNLQTAKKIKIFLEKKKGCKDVRIQTIDFSKKYSMFDLEKCVENWGLCKVEAPYIDKFLNKDK